MESRTRPKASWMAANVTGRRGAWAGFAGMRTGLDIMTGLKPKVFSGPRGVFFRRRLRLFTAEHAVIGDDNQESSRNQIASRLRLGCRFRRLPAQVYVDGRRSLPSFCNR